MQYLGILEENLNLCVPVSNIAMLLGRAGGYVDVVVDDLLPCKADGGWSV